MTGPDEASERHVHLTAGRELRVRPVYVLEHVRQHVPGVAEEALAEGGSHGSMVVGGMIHRT